MPTSDCYLFKNSIEFVAASDVSRVPKQTRGIYVLFHEREKHMEVVYVGMARGEKTGIRGRLISHKKRKSDLWTHFSAFEVWDNIPKKQVEELEGLFRHIYRRDSAANKLNIQKTYKPLDAVSKKTVEEWANCVPPSGSTRRLRLRRSRAST